MRLIIFRQEREIVSRLGTPVIVYTKFLSEASGKEQQKVLQTGCYLDISV